MNRPWRHRAPIVIVLRRARSTTPFQNRSCCAAPPGSAARKGPAEPATPYGHSPVATGFRVAFGREVPVGPLRKGFARTS